MTPVTTASTFKTNVLGGSKKQIWCLGTVTTGCLQFKGYCTDKTSMERKLKSDWCTFKDCKGLCICFWTQKNQKYMNTAPLPEKKKTQHIDLFHGMITSKRTSSQNLNKAPQLRQKLLKWIIHSLTSKQMLSNRTSWPLTFYNWARRKRETFDIQTKT